MNLTTEYIGKSRIRLSMEEKTVMEGKKWKMTQKNLGITINYLFVMILNSK